VTASAGNAGLGVAWAAAALGVPATIVVPETASPAKVAALRALPVTLAEHGADYDGAEAHALGLSGAAYVSSYNDTGVIAGQATLGRELDAQLPGPLTVVAPLGGGSLASGLGLWAAHRPGGGAHVVAAEADRSPALSTALEAGEITPFTVGDTLADGLAGNLEPGSITFPIIRDHVADVVRITEPEIEDAIRFLAREHGLVAEGAGAVATAAVRGGHVPRGDGALVAIVSGRNIALPRLAAVLGAA
jgi:threonine dehydratase